MEGVFVQRKGVYLGLTFLLFAILFIILHFVLRGTVTAERALILLLISLLFCPIAELCILFNFNAYIRIDKSTIKARYHFFGKLDCNIKDIEFVLPQINTLTILLKNGKRHVIIGVENSWQLSDYLRFQCFEAEKGSPDTIRQELSHAQAAWRRDVILVLIGIVLLFAEIFATVLLTGGKELYEFNKADQTVFEVMGCIGLFTLISCFFAAEHAGKLLLPREQLKYRLRGAVIVSSPLPTNNTIAVYTDWDYSGRVVLCGFPNDESIYYCLQKFTEDFELKTTYTSKIYDSRDKLPSEEQLIDITASVSAST